MPGTRPGMMSQTIRDAAVQSRKRTGLALSGVTPGFVPVLARGIDDTAVGLEELVGDLKDREHQPAFGTPCDVAAARLAPDEFTGLGLDTLRRAFLVDQMPLKNVGLLDVDVLMIGQHRARRE